MNSIINNHHHTQRYLDEIDIHDQGIHYNNYSTGAGVLMDPEPPLYTQ